jgi:lysophospholipase L1-like esterase
MPHSPSSPSPHVSLRAKLAAVCGALVVSAALCELMARAVFPAPPTPGREPAILYQSVPGVGFVHAPLQQGWIDDGWVTTNALGLRGSVPETAPANGELRVLAIGDSTTFGWGVNDAETYPSQLEARLRQTWPGREVRVINGGISGYDLRRAARLLRYLAPRLHPDIVIVGAFWNDLPYEVATPEGVALAARSTSPVSRADADASEGPGSESKELSRPFRIGNEAPTGLNRLLRSSRMLFVLRHAWLARAPSDAGSNQVQWERALLEGKQTPAIDAAWDDVAGALQEIRALGEAGGYDVGVLVIPIRAQVERPYPQAQYQSRLRAIAEGIGMFVIDPLPGFLDGTESKRLFIPYDRMHFSAEGNARLAGAAAEFLRAWPESERASSQGSWRH